MSHPLEKYLSGRGVQHSLLCDGVEAVLHIEIPFNRSSVPKYHPFWKNWRNSLDLTTAFDELLSLFEKDLNKSPIQEFSDSEVEIKPVTPPTSNPESGSEYEPISTSEDWNDGGRSSGEFSSGKNTSSSSEASRRRVFRRRKRRRVIYSSDGSSDNESGLASNSKQHEPIEEV